MWQRRQRGGTGWLCSHMPTVMCYDTGVYNLPAQDEGPISPHLLAVLRSALSSAWVLARYSEYTMLLLSWLMCMEKVPSVWDILI